MNNKFKVTVCRFHTKQKDRLLIVGSFEEDVIGDNQLSLQLDSQEVSFELDERKKLTGGIVRKNGIPLTKEYFLWIDLPTKWRDSNELLVINRDGNGVQEVYKIPVAKIKKAEKYFHEYIDEKNVYEDCLVVKGWYIDNGHAKLQFLDTTGSELPMRITKRKRTDVMWSYPENSEEEVVGFEAVYKGDVSGKITIHFEEGSKVKDYTVNMKISPVGQAWNKMKKIFHKVIISYHQMGAKATLLKIKDRIIKRDMITYAKWYKRHCPTDAMLEQQRKYRFSYQPKISIVIPLYKTPLNYLDELITSIEAQTYSNWELCLSDGSGENSPLTKVLQEYEEEDSRIKVVYNEIPLRISENTNAALKIATGDYIAFADHDDLVAPNALYECVYALNEDLELEILYTDEDKVDMAGKEHFMPHFKSDFNIDMLRSINYICHLFVIKRTVFDKVGFLNPAFDGAQDYDFVLRCVETTSKIKHIPKILYHWRAHKDSTAENPESKKYAFEAGARAIKAHYDRVGIQANVEKTGLEGLYRTKYILQGEPLVSIVIPNKDHIDDLEKCISSIEHQSTYRNYEFIIVENNSTEESTFEYYNKLEATCPRAKVVYWKEKGFNYPAINNYGVEQAKGEYILFLNNDIEIVNDDCLEELLGYCMRKDVGAVGAQLYYEDGTIQHAGVIVGLGGVAGHAFVGYPHDDWGYFGRIKMAQDYSAVTAACVMVKRTVFEEVEGFDEKYAVAFNDVDLCMKIRRAGYLIVYNPHAELNHYESKSRGYEDTEEKIKRFNSEIDLFQSRWGDFLEKGDPYYNPNLTLDRADFSLSMEMNKIGL